MPARHLGDENLVFAQKAAAHYSRFNGLSSFSRAALTDILSPATSLTADRVASVPDVSLSEAIASGPAPDRRPEASVSLKQVVAAEVMVSPTG
jgi:hypothetical protein